MEDFNSIAEKAGTAEKEDVNVDTHTRDVEQSIIEQR